MKRVLFFAALFLFVSTSIYSLNKFSFGVSGAAVVPQSGETGAGTFLSLSYKPFENLATAVGVGFIGWGNSQVNYYTHTIGYYSLSAKYLFKIANFNPYISREIGYAAGKYRYETGYNDESLNRWFNTGHEYLSVSEILSGVGVGFIYPLWKSFFLDTSFNAVLTTETNSLFHSRFSIGMNYEL